MKTININDYCAKKLTKYDLGQEYLRQPFLLDGFVCATDKNIIIRLDSEPTSSYEPLKLRLVASAVSSLFSMIDSKGWLFDSLEDCCDMDDSIVAGVMIGEKYIEQLQSLPELKLGKVMTDYVGFTFAGGIGIIKGLDY